ncbi:MAG: hypothetical protein ACXWPM_07420 [Bdellovibrionota bacterium]
MIRIVALSLVLLSYPVLADESRAQPGGGEAEHFSLSTGTDLKGLLPSYSNGEVIQFHIRNPETGKPYDSRSGILLDAARLNTLSDIGAIRPKGVQDEKAVQQSFTGFFEALDREQKKGEHELSDSLSDHVQKHGDRIRVLVGKDRASATYVGIGAFDDNIHNGLVFGGSFDFDNFRHIANDPVSVRYLRQQKAERKVEDYFYAHFDASVWQKFQSLMKTSAQEDKPRKFAEFMMLVTDYLGSAKDDQKVHRILVQSGVISPKHRRVDAVNGVERSAGGARKPAQGEAAGDRVISMPDGEAHVGGK